MKVAIQGGRASFHEIASRKYFEGEPVEVVECRTFEDVCRQVDTEQVEYGMMAIENTIAGSILLNYGLIQKYDLRIVGEIKLRIKQNLMALPGQKLEDIKKVMSHYMALNQCTEFLDQYPVWEREEYYDTADSAKAIKEEDLNGVAAIAGDFAAELYGLEVLAPEIETFKQNFTRFLVLVPKSINNPRLDGPTNKATISFELPDQVGSLAKALTIVVDHKINLTKIQSLPILGKPDQYTFYMDCMWDDYQDMRACLIALRHLVPRLNVMGEYRNSPVVV